MKLFASATEVLFWSLMSFSSAYAMDAKTDAKVISLPGIHAQNGLAPLAQNSDMFTYESAESRFAIASVPTMDDLQGAWRLVGIAEIPSAVDNDLFGMYPGYFENGLIQLPGRSDSFKVDVSFDRTTDIFGKNQLSFTRTVTNAETQKTYRREGPFTVSMTDQAMTYSTPSYSSNGAQNDMSIARFDQSCRLTNTTDTQPLLLCERMLMGSGQGIGSAFQPYFNKVIGYEAFKKGM